jgi:hypothetical protein
MRGTRYNAKKVDTKETYFTSKIWEFQMSCRKCSHPFKIRTNPQDRGFDYVEGIKIQAGQEPSAELLTNTIATNMTKNDFDRLEMQAKGKRQRQTEYEELLELQKLNQSCMYNDADSNANIRSRFRKDRKEKRSRIHLAGTLGWKDGMEIVGNSLGDAVAAKETVFGRSKATEARRFGDLKKSSIFSDPKKKKRRRKRVDEESLSTQPPALTSSNAISITAQPTKDCRAHKTKKIIAGRVITKQSSPTVPKAQVSSLSEMLAAYGSDSEED